MHQAADYKIICVSGQFLVTGNENERLGAFMNQLVDTFPFITFCSFNELHRGMRTQQLKIYPLIVLSCVPNKE